MKRTRAINFLLITTAGTWLFGWKQWSADQAANQQIAELNEKIELVSKSEMAAQEELLQWNAKEIYC